MKEKTDKSLALISPKELSLVNDNALNSEQLEFILRKTPAQYVRQRPAKGGGTWDYVSGGYVKKVLNLMFGWSWDFEILEQDVIDGEAIVKGRLTVRTNGKTIIKTQFGNKDVVYKKQPDENGNRIPLSRGNDLKAAATDCLKKCASELGIAADIYNAQEFKEVYVDTSEEITKEQLSELLEKTNGKLSPEEKVSAQRIINNQEKNSYKKLLNNLQKYEQQ